jgi:hypothetical protein
VLLLARITKILGQLAAPVVTPACNLARRLAVPKLQTASQCQLNMLHNVLRLGFHSYLGSLTYLECRVLGCDHAATSRKSALSLFNPALLEAVLSDSSDAQPVYAHRPALPRVAGCKLESSMDQS